MTLFLHLDGIPPSKKNEHQIFFHRKTHRRIVAPSEAYRRWENAAMMILRSQTKTREKLKSYPVRVSITYLVRNNRIWDLSNKTESVMDALVRAGIFKDDNRFVVEELRQNWCHASNDGVDIEISTLI